LNQSLVAAEMRPETQLNLGEPSRDKTSKPLILRKPASPLRYQQESLAVTMEAEESVNGEGVRPNKRQASPARSFSMEQDQIPTTHPTTQTPPNKRHIGSVDSGD
jgi:hypothetical protein